MGSHVDVITVLPELSFVTCVLSTLIRSKWGWTHGVITDAVQPDYCQLTHDINLWRKKIGINDAYTSQWISNMYNVHHYWLGVRRDVPYALFYFLQYQHDHSNFFNLKNTWCTRPLGVLKYGVNMGWPDEGLVGGRVESKIVKAWLIKMWNDNTSIQKLQVDTSYNFVYYIWNWNQIRSKMSHGHYFSRKIQKTHLKISCAHGVLNSYICKCDKYVENVHSAVYVYLDSRGELSNSISCLSKRFSKCHVKIHFSPKSTAQLSPPKKI